uniref:Uncharacterized protein n=1 Tax=Leersia perrieri TaxID=77586 RepID=A0A0D9UY85_9ORYZ
MVQEHGGSSHLLHHHHQQQQQQQQTQLAKYGGGGVARASRKNKPKKVPQRGLGVAQLEKLRIEEQKKMEGGGATALSSHLAPPLPPPPSLALSAALQSRSAADGGGFIPPAMWSPVDPIKYKRSMCPQTPSPMVSTGLSLTAAASQRHHPTEPPSNQMYSSSGGSRSSATAAAEEERETAGVDRSWPFMFEGMAAFRTTTTSRAPPPVAPLPFSARMMTGELAGLADFGPDPSRYEFRATNYFGANASYSDWTSDFAHCKSSKENGRPRDPAFLTLSSQPPHLIKQPHLMPSYNDFSAIASQASE